MRSATAVGTVILVATLLTSCTTTGSNLADGPAAADLADEAPYGSGAVVGRDYDYVLLAHCGVQWTRIDGVWWETDLLDDGSGNPPEGWGNPYDAGVLTLLGENTAEYSGGPGVTIVFERTELVQPPVGCD